MPRKPRFPDFPRLNKFYYHRHGKPRYYIDGVALKNRSTFGSAEFRTEYERVCLLSSTTHDAVPTLGAINGSFRWGCETFMKATFAPSQNSDTIRPAPAS